MKIIDPVYAITFAIIIIGFPFLIYIQMATQKLQTLHITIVGLKIQTSLLLYYLNRLPQSQLIKITIIRDYNDNQSTNNHTIMDHRLISLCGIQKSLMSMLQEFQMQYMIKPYGIYYNSSHKSLKEIKQNTFSSIWDYGLSHYTAQELFDKFIEHLSQIEPQKFREKTFLGLLSKLIPDQPYNSGRYYLSEILGLDQLYLSDYINPMISASYMNDVNSLSTMFKILPLYCQKSLAILLDENYLQQQILNSKQVKPTIIQKLKIKQHRKIFNQKGRNQIQITLENDSKILTNLIVFVEKFQNHHIKLISFHQTLVDGKILNDEDNPDIYTLYFSDKLIRSITRLCANECKNYRNSIYLIVSEARITQSNLKMFTQHEIIFQRKKFIPRQSLPDHQKFQQTQQIYRIHQTQTVSDNFEFKLSVFKNIANIISDKYLS